ncbi:hypothetical protein QJS04_geneDACA004544 [Acorus gramineus]|uniref:Uncharacterized protein n=1 Tax=Acorus gramineus TaxID=55184 RepID=A0AAV9BUX6_ACOGR|nr:hypothetical protein QJS04_geneDACA004544 [Acorus gramineus]
MVTWERMESQLIQVHGEIGAWGRLVAREGWVADRVSRWGRGHRWGCGRWVRGAMGTRETVGRGRVARSVLRVRSAQWRARERCYSTVVRPRQQDNNPRSHNTTATAATTHNNNIGVPINEEKGENNNEKEAETAIIMDCWDGLVGLTDNGPTMMSPGDGPSSSSSSLLLSSMMGQEKVGSTAMETTMEEMMMMWSWLPSWEEEMVVVAPPEFMIDGGGSGGGGDFWEECEIARRAMELWQPSCRSLSIMADLSGLNRHCSAGGVGRTAGPDCARRSRNGVYSHAKILNVPGRVEVWNLLLLFLPCQSQVES